MNKYISFIAPAYNVNRYLDDFFSSFKKLDKNMFELIFVDDKSPEDPTKFVEKYKSDFKITYVRNKKNLGLGFSRNEGLKKVSKKSTHVIYIDTDDMLDDISFIDDVKEDKITGFNDTYFTKTDKKYENRVGNFGKNLFGNTIGGVSIPTEIALENKFEARYFEDMLVNRRLIGKYNEDIILSKKSIILYRYRNSGINSSKPTIEKYTSFLNEMKKILDEGYNTYRFNIQEIYQYYYMGKKHLKGFDESLLPKTKGIYKCMFKATGTLIRVLKIETLVYGRGKKNAFD